MKKCDAVWIQRLDGRVGILRAIACRQGLRIAQVDKEADLSLGPTLLALALSTDRFSRTNLNQECY